MYSVVCTCTIEMLAFYILMCVCAYTCIIVMPNVHVHNLIILEYTRTKHLSCILDLHVHVHACMHCVYIFVFLAVSTVRFPPEFITEPTSQQVNLFDRVVFTCSATGQPTPTYRWLKDGVVIEGRFNPQLTFDQAQLSDRGFYTCQASNSEGTINSRQALLNIIGDYRPFHTSLEI